MCLVYQHLNGPRQQLLEHLQQEWWTMVLLLLDRTCLCLEEDVIFGGKCSHNELYALNINSKVWRKIPCTDGPMEKYSCGFISYSYQGTDYLLALGGMSRKQPTQQQQQHSLYIPSGYGSYFTNEIHTMEMTSSQGNVYMYNYYSVILIIIIIILINPFFYFLHVTLLVENLKY